MAANKQKRHGPDVQDEKPTWRTCQIDSDVHVWIE